MELKHSGLIRNLDALGRVVIPAEMRRSLALSPEDPMELNMVEYDGVQAVLVVPHRPADTGIGKQAIKALKKLAAQIYQPGIAVAAIERGSSRWFTNQDSDTIRDTIKNAHGDLFSLATNKAPVELILRGKPNAVYVCAAPIFTSPDDKKAAFIAVLASEAELSKEQILPFECGCAMINAMCV